jgi:hypothetical protein
LTPEEQRTLLGILEECLSDIREGLVKAESMEFKAQHKARKAIVKGLIARLQVEQSKAA